jgi:hypothetical protein
MKKIVIFLCLLGLMAIAYGIDNCLDFDGVDDYVTVLDNAALNPGYITVEAWINTDDIAGQTHPPIVKKSTGDNGYALEISSSDNTVKLWLYINDGWYSSPTCTLELDNWFHIAGTYDGETINLYVNGIQIDSGTAVSGSITSATGTPLSIGKDLINTTRLYDGKIDEVRIWSDARGIAEIRQNMYRELNGNEAGLVAYYKFNETSGTTADDAKGNNDGELTNMDDSDWVVSSAMFGPKNCLEFDGNNDHVKVATMSPTFTQGTISFWINPKATPSNHARVFSDHWNDDEIYLQSGTGKVATFFMINGGDLMSSAPLPNNQWTHVAITMDDASSQLYINGVLDDESGPSDTEITSTFEIGGYSTSGNYEVVNGYLDEFRIWSVVRSPEEIRADMFKNLTGDEDNLTAYYNFDNASGDTLQDFSGNGNDGDLTNMADNDWVASSAFNSWLNTNSTTWASASNWSNGVPVSTDNVGVYSLDADPSIAGLPTVHNLYLGSGVSANLSSGITINQSLILGTNLDLNGQTITLGSAAQLYEDSGRLYGSTGTITTTRSLGAVTNENIAGLGAEITTATSLGNTTITRGHTAQGGAGNMGIQRYYEIAPAANTGLDATLVFHYDDAELNGKTENDLELFRSTDSGASWFNQGGTVDPGANTITLSSIDAFSRWTASDGENPLPVMLSSFSAFFNQHPTLQWTTQSETDNAGWNVYRSSTELFEDSELLTGEMIPGAGTTSQATDYIWEDTQQPSVGAEYWYWLESVSYSGATETFGPVTLTIPYEEPGQNNPEVPRVYGLMQNHPNPFNPSTEISFVLPQSAHCTIDVYDIAGRKIKTLLNEPVAGEELTSVFWQGDDAQGNPVASGIYFYKMRAGKYTSTRKMILMK